MDGQLPILKLRIGMIARYINDKKIFYKRTHLK